MNNEIKYCKFCNKEKPIEEFVKSGFAIRNICRECQNKKQTQIYRDSKKVKELEKENKELKKQIEEYIKAETKMEDEYRELEKQLEEERKKVSEYSYKLSNFRCEETYKNQQKEFIEWLENTIKEMENTQADDIHQQVEKDSCLAVADTISSKYKEIVGVKDE